ncbi:MAG: N-(5'-phosphoribosyl)anthranilate isomerase [Gemmatales bacterium]|nr:MAG: N-(5'-phosphoribosyl)anthranilate isomerase [Gemmatales bacterium]
MSSLRIKICGITNRADAVEAAESGADAIGLNFYAPSPRSIQPKAAAEVLRSLPPFVEPVGVFVNEPLSEACRQARNIGMLRTIQWHGDHHQVYDTFPFRYIPAFGVQSKDDLVRIQAHVAACKELGHPPAAVLIDARVEGQYGGTGVQAPWALLADFDPGVPIVLAGGLTAENVAEAVQLVRPYAVDVASGVESSPGKKDAEKMRRFIANARSAAAAVLS